MVASPRILSDNDRTMRGESRNVQGVPEQFSDEKDSARFRHLAQVPGVELYHAHISRYAFEPHTHEAFGIGAMKPVPSAFSSWHAVRCPSPLGRDDESG